MSKKRKHSMAAAKAVSRESQIVPVIMQYAGMLVTPNVIITQLREKGVFVSRATVRNWLTRTGCVLIDSINGLYRVPEQEKPSGQSTESAGESNAIPEPAVTS